MLYMVSEFLISNLRNCCPDEEIKMLCCVLWHSESLVDCGFFKKNKITPFCFSMWVSGILINNLCSTVCLINQKESKSRLFTQVP